MKNSYREVIKQISELPLAEQQIQLGAFLTQLFQERQVGLTIVGGAAVQYYTDAEYVTKDLDAILVGDTTEIIESVMHQIGFKRTSTYRHFENLNFNFIVEFPPEPVEVGSRYISKFIQVGTKIGPVRVIRVEDLIMDRIIAGVEWKSEESLKQAKLLWFKNKDQIDKKYLKDFAKEEGYEKDLKKVMTR